MSCESSGTNNSEQNTTTLKVEETTSQLGGPDEMLKTSYNRPSLLDKFNQSKVKFNEIDVIGK